MEQHAMETMASYGEKATFGGAAFTIFSSLTLSQWATVIGIVVSIAGLVVMTYYKHKSFKLEEAARNREVEAVEQYYKEKSKS